MERLYSSPKQVNKNTIQLDVKERIDGEVVNEYPMQVESDVPDEQLKALYDQAESGEFGEIADVSGSDLDALRTSYINQLMALAAKEQQALVGTHDNDRQQRFSKNLEAAKALLSSNANAAQQEMLEIQLLANQQSGHTATATMTLREFAGWIAAYDDITTRAAGMLEALLITYRAHIQSISDESQMALLTEQFVDQAHSQIQELLQ